MQLSENIVPSISSQVYYMLEFYVTCMNSPKHKNKVKYALNTKQSSTHSGYTVLVKVKHPILCCVFYHFLSYSWPTKSVNHAPFLWHILIGRWLMCSFLVFSKWQKSFYFEVWFIILEWAYQDSTVKHQYLFWKICLWYDWWLLLCQSSSISLVL